MFVVNHFMHINSQTSAPDLIMTHCKQLAAVYYGRRLNRMYVHMLEGFPPRQNSCRILKTEETRG